MIIERYFSESILKHIKSDFQFLIDKIIKSGFEYEIQIRENYFNLYYRGNSIGKVSYNTRTKLYKIEIHDKFIGNEIKERFVPKEGNRLAFFLEKEQLNSFFSSKNILLMARKVKKIYFQEEIIFEQMIITDNINRQDLIMIDRQVVDKKNRTKIDLLALRQKNDKDYQFCVIEVKLGNNPELRGAVATQLKGYINRISNNFGDYKKCYEINIGQKQYMGLFASKFKINIVPDVLGVVVVLGYSGIAKASIKELRKIEPTIGIIQLKSIVDLSRITRLA